MRSLNSVLLWPVLWMGVAYAQSTTPPVSVKLAAPRSDLTADGTITTASNAVIGVNFDALTQDMGTMTRVPPVYASKDQATFLFQVDPTRSCAVDVSPLGGADQWKRTISAPAVGNRLVVVSSLESGVSYKYRILCFTLQDNSLYVDLYLPEEISTGIFSTLTVRRR